MKSFSFPLFPLHQYALAGRACRRGFTLVELIMALAIGLSISMAAYLLAKNATRVFQQEARITSTQLSVTLGMDRIAADLQRAAFLSSPNMQPTVKPVNCVPANCDPDDYVSPDNAQPKYVGKKSEWPDGLKKLAAFTIEKHDLADGELKQSNENGFDPERITIGGSFATTEQFPAHLDGQMSPSGNLRINVKRMSPEMQRTLEPSTKPGGPSELEILKEIFKEGRFLRIEDVSQGIVQYGVVTGMGPGDPTAIPILLAALPAIYKSGVNNLLHEQAGGLAGFAVGTIVVNPVYRIRYDIRSLKGDPRYGGLVQEVTPELTGDDGRTELIRVELDESDQEIPESLELIAEYAVDLRFGITVRNKNNPPAIERFPIQEPAHPKVLELAALPGVGLSQPETVRAVQVRLTTRSRTPDRETDLGGFEDAGDGRRYRFKIGTVKAEAKYARLRTHYADILLPNLETIEW